jgi:hypothetical protein
VQAFQFPAELQSNWLFRMTEAGWGEASRVATRKCVLLLGLAPTLLLFAPLELAVWGCATWFLHTAFQFMTGAMLVEVLFWSFDKIPFTCSYFPGKTNLALLAGIYLYGFTSYSFKMAEWETALDRNPYGAIVFILTCAVVLVYVWRLRRLAVRIEFEAGAPQVQSLDLN